jgi:hypothetical protein
MTQPQANQNQNLLDLGFTQDEIDYARECCAPLLTVLSNQLDEDDSQFFDSFDYGVPESVTEDIFEQTETVQRMNDGIVARPPVVTFQ